MHLECIYLILTVLYSAALALVEIPKFSQMKLLYPGYFLYNGDYRDEDVRRLIGANFDGVKGHDTASLRMSYALNKYGGRHAIGKEPIMLSKRGRDSVTGADGQEYIFRNTAFGPFLGAKYGNPLLAKPDNANSTRTMLPFMRKQGIVRFVSYHRHPGGHIALWDCDHFYKSRDFTTETNIISVEFWETPDSYCPPPNDGSTVTPHLVRISSDRLQILAQNSPPRNPEHETHYRPHLRHRHRQTHGQDDHITGPKRHRGNPKTTKTWTQS